MFAVVWHEQPDLMMCHHLLVTTHLSAPKNNLGLSSTAPAPGWAHRRQALVNTQDVQKGGRRRALAPCRILPGFAKVWHK